MISDETYEHVVEEENYFVSMTDMMVGLVFIFIIMLMYFALQFRDVTDQLTSANRTRDQILREIQKSLKDKGVTVQIDTENGVLHLPDSILFDKGKADLREDGQAAAEKLASTLFEVLPCYVNGNPVPARCKSKSSHFIESIYVEGHTDVDQPHGVECLKDNFALSACRSVATFRALIAYQPSLNELCSRDEDGPCQKILSVSGYGAERPVSAALGEESQKHNRRIDLRVLMLTPDGGATATAVAKGLANNAKP
jgi:flagellar motor protein MotB